MNTIEAPASRAASSRLPRPSARDTSAEVAMVKPIATEMVKNSSVAAKPTAAVSDCDAEQRDVEEVERIDDEDRDKADRAGRRHDDDVPHRRAGDEFGGLAPVGGRHGITRFDMRRVGPRQT